MANGLVDQDDAERAEACLKAALEAVPDAMVPLEMVFLAMLMMEHNTDPKEMIVVAYLMGRANGDAARIADHTYQGMKKS